jgi:parallel beta-helix repeat protein
MKTPMNMLRGMRFAAVMALVWATSAVAVTTNTYHVVSGNPSPELPYNTWAKAAADIQTAVNKAAADLVPGTTECVVVVTSGTYTVTSQISVTNAITLRSFSGNRNDTIIAGGYPASTNRCLYITGANAVVDGFTITNGYVNASSPSTNYGGGVYMATNATLRNCTVTGNQARKGTAFGRGCGVYLAGGGLITNCTLSLNTSDNAAGVGAYLDNGGMVSGCTIVSNTVTASQTAEIGGGLYVSGGSVVSNCVIAYNKARAGGGVFLDYGNQVILCTIRDNMATLSGGGVYFDRGPGIVNRCRILRNTSVTGGGLYAVYNDHVWDSLIAGNQASASGGGMHISGSASKNTIRNCTIIRNKAGAAYGGVSMFVTNCLNMYNTIIYDNTAVTTNNVGGPVGTSILQYNCTTDPDVVSEGNISGNPLFTDTGSGSGTNAVLGDYTLQLSSLCIGAGTNGAVTNSLDLAGNARIRPAWGRVDIGAYEALDASGLLTNSFTAVPTNGAAPLTVAFTGETGGSTNGLLCQWVFGDGATNDWSTNIVVAHTYTAAATNAYTATMNVTNASGETSTYSLPIMVHPAIVYVATNGPHVAPFDTWAKAASNIQAAVDAAGDGYTTAAIVSNGIYTVTTHIALNKGITVRSVTTNWADVIVKGGYPASSNRCFHITSANAVLDGFTITNGNWTNGAAGSAGGGILMSAGLVRNCLVIGNSSKGYGGGVEMTGGRLLNCEVLNNSSPNGNGGGIRMIGASTVVSNCLVAGNLAVGGGGGGLRVDANSLLVDCVVSNNSAANAGGIYLAGDGTVANCRIVANRSTADGGGVRIFNNPGKVRNCLIAGNAASKNGGGIAVAEDGASIDNCTIVGNSAATNGGWYQTAVSTGVNCIVYFNQATNSSATADIGGTQTNFLYSCSPDLVAGVNSNRNSDPMFAVPGSGYGTNHVVGNYHLKEGSPCANAGLYLSWMASATDLEGEAYVPGDSPNMGTYERTVKAGGSLIMLR